MKDYDVQDILGGGLSMEENGKDSTNPEEYDDYDEEVIERDVYQDEEPEEELAEGDEEYYDEEEPAEEEYYDEEPYEEEYYDEQPVADEYYDDRMQQILDELAELKNNVKQSGNNAPAPYYPPQAPSQPQAYFMPQMPAYPPQQNNSNDFMLNELSRLRDENIRAATSQEINSQIARMKEDFSRELAFRDGRPTAAPAPAPQTVPLTGAVQQQPAQTQPQGPSNTEMLVLQELKKLNNRIDDLEKKEDFQDGGTENVMHSAKEQHSGQPQKKSNGQPQDTAQNPAPQVAAPKKPQPYVPPKELLRLLETSEIILTRFVDIDAKLDSLDSQVSEVSLMAMTNDIAPLSAEIASIKNDVQELLEQPVPTFSAPPIVVESADGSTREAVSSVGYEEISARLKDLANLYNSFVGRTMQLKKELTDIKRTLGFDPIYTHDEGGTVVFTPIRKRLDDLKAGVDNPAMTLVQKGLKLIELNDMMSLLPQEAEPELCAEYDAARNVVLNLSVYRRDAKNIATETGFSSKLLPIEKFFELKDGLAKLEGGAYESCLKQLTEQKNKIQDNVYSGYNGQLYGEIVALNKELKTADEKGPLQDKLNKLLENLISFRLGDIVRLPDYQHLRPASVYECGGIQDNLIAVRELMDKVPDSSANEIIFEEVNKVNETLSKLDERLDTDSCLAELDNIKLIFETIDFPAKFTDVEIKVEEIGDSLAQYIADPEKYADVKADILSVKDSVAALANADFVSAILNDLAVIREIGETSLSPDAQAQLVNDANAVNEVLAQISAVKDSVDLQSSLMMDSVVLSELQGVASKLDVLENGVAQKLEALDNILSGLTVFDEKLEAYKQTAAANRDDIIASVQTVNPDLLGEFDSLRSDIVAAIDGLTPAMAEEISKMREEVTASSNSVNPAYTDQLTRVEQGLETLTAVFGGNFAHDVKALQEDMARLGEIISGDMQTQVALMQTELTELNLSLTALTQSQDMASLKESIDNASLGIATMTDDVETIKNSTTGIETMAEVAGLKDSLAVLTEKLNVYIDGEAEHPIADEVYALREELSNLSALVSQDTLALGIDELKLNVAASAQDVADIKSALEENKLFYEESKLSYLEQTQSLTQLKETLEAQALDNAVSQNSESNSVTEEFGVKLDEILNSVTSDFERVEYKLNKSDNDAVIASLAELKTQLDALVTNLPDTAALSEDVSALKLGVESLTADATNAEIIDQITALNDTIAVLMQNEAALGSMTGTLDEIKTQLSELTANDLSVSLMTEIMSLREDITAIGGKKTDPALLGELYKIQDMLETHTTGTETSQTNEENASTIPSRSTALLFEELEAVKVLLGEREDADNDSLDALNEIKELLATKQSGIDTDIAAQIQSIKDALDNLATADNDDEVFENASSGADAQDSAAEILESIKALRDDLGGKSADFDLLAEIVSLKEELRALSENQNTKLAEQINAIQDELKSLTGTIDNELESESMTNDTEDPVMTEVRGIKTDIADQYNSFTSLREDNDRQTEAILNALHDVKNASEQGAAMQEIAAEIQELRDLVEQLTGGVGDKTEGVSYGGSESDILDKLSGIQEELFALRQDQQALGEVAYTNTDESPASYRAYGIDNDKIISEIRGFKDDVTAHIGNTTLDDILTEVNFLRQEIADKSASGTTDTENAQQQQNDGDASLDAVTALHSDILAQIQSLREELSQKLEAAATQETVTDSVSEHTDTALSERIDSFADSLSFKIDATAAALEELRAAQAEAYLSQSGIGEQIENLKTELYIKQGEVDPEILDEIRSLKTALESRDTAAETQTIVDTISQLKEELTKNIDAEFNVEVVGQINELKTAIDVLRQEKHDDLVNELRAIKIDWEIMKPYQTPEVLEQLESIKNEVAENNSSQPDLEQTLNALREEIAEAAQNSRGNEQLIEMVAQMRGEISAMRDTALGVNAEENEQVNAQLFDMVDALSEELAALREENQAVAVRDSAETNAQLLETLAELQSEVSAIGTQSVDPQVLDMLTELKSGFEDLKEKTDINQNLIEMLTDLKTDVDDADTSAQAMQKLADALDSLKTEMLLSKADSDNHLIVEIASVREQLDELKKGSDTQLSLGESAEQNAVLQEELAGIRESTDQLLSRGGDEASELIRSLADEVRALRDDVVSLSHGKEFLDSESSVSSVSDGETMLTLIDEIRALRGEVESLKSAEPQVRESAVAPIQDLSLLTDEIRLLKEQLAEAPAQKEAAAAFDADIFREIIRQEVAGAALAANVNAEQATVVDNQTLAEIRAMMLRREDNVNQIYAEMSKLKEDIKRELTSQRESDRTTLNFMVEMTKMLEQQSTAENKESNEQILNEIANLKGEIVKTAGTYAQSSIDENAIIQEISKLKRELSQSTNEAIVLDNAIVIEELSKLKEELSNEKPSAFNEQLLAEIARIKDDITAISEKDGGVPPDSKRIADSLSELKKELSNIAVIVDDKTMEAAKTATAKSTTNKRGIGGAVKTVDLDAVSKTAAKSTTASKTGGAAKSTSTAKSTAAKKTDTAKTSTAAKSKATAPASTSAGSKKTGGTTAKTTIAKAPEKSKAKIVVTTAKAKASTTKTKASTGAKTAQKQSEHKDQQTTITSVVTEANASQTPVKTAPQPQPVSEIKTLPFNDTATEGDELNIADLLARQVANKLIMEQLVQQLADGGVPQERVSEIVSSILPSEENYKFDDQSDTIKRLANQLVLDKLRARLNLKK